MHGLGLRGLKRVVVYRVGTLSDLTSECTSEPASDCDICAGPTHTLCCDVSASRTLSYVEIVL